MFRVINTQETLSRGHKRPENSLVVFITVTLFWSTVHLA